MQEETPPAVGTTLDGRYRIVSVAEAHGLGSSCVAYDLQQDRLVTVLLLSRRLGAAVAVLERLARTNQAVIGLAAPDLVPYDRAGLSGGQYYLVRRHLEGQSLRQWLVTSNSPAVDAAVHLAVRLGEALAPAHRAGLVHGGLSPDSIWVQPDGGLSLVDFGLLPALGAELARLSPAAGALRCLAPEQLAGQEAHPAADVYAIGVLLSEMLAGRLPAAAAEPRTGRETVPFYASPDSTAQAGGQPEPLALAQVVQTAMSPEPSTRYRNAGQLVHVLQSLASRAPSTLPGAIPAAATAAAAPRLVVPAPRRRRGAAGSEPVYYPEFEQEQRPVRSWRVDWVLVALILAALLAVGGLILLWREVYARYTGPVALSTLLLIFAPSPRRGEGWGEGQDIPRAFQFWKILD